MARANQERAALVKIFRAAVAAADPARLVRERLAVGRGGAEVRVGARRRLRLHGRRVFVIAAGKAARAMAAAACEALGARLTAGLVISPERCASIDRRLVVVRAGHPLPDRRSVAAGRRAWRLCREARADDVVLVLLSGGASSLLELPAPGITLPDLVRTNAVLLGSGAPIAAINAVRKHISRLKGGGLVRASRAPVIALLLSDVIGGDASTIGSGPAAPDPTTFGDAIAVVERFALSEALPRRVMRRLRRGADGALAETLKPRERPTTNLVIGDNRLALAAASRAARALGAEPVVLTASLRGDVRRAAARLARALRRRRPGRRPICLLAGGETTVEVRGRGRGGRNQHRALLLAREIAGMNGIVGLCAGSDGRDGPTDAAGAFVDGATWARARAAGFDPDSVLARNDSYTLFRRLGDSFRTGPTGTNVMDLDILVRSRTPAGEARSPRGRV